MKTKELIDRFSAYPPDSEIYVAVNGSGDFAFGVITPDGHETDYILLSEEMW